MCRMSACRKLQEFVILRVTACSNSFVDLNPFGLSKERGEELSGVVGVAGPVLGHGQESDDDSALATPASLFHV